MRPRNLPRRTALRTTAACGALLMLAGCDLAPAYHAPLVATPVAFSQRDSVFKPAAPVPIDANTWWTLFNDPTLNAVEAQVDTQNPDLAASLAAYQQARAFAAEAESGIYPEISLGGSLSANRQSNNRPLRGANQPNQYGANTIDASASYELDLWDRIHNAIVAGKALTVASQANLAAVRLSLHAELASDYFALRGLDAQAALLASTVGAYQRALDLTQVRFQGHIASGLDVSRAQTQLDSARTDVSDVAARRDKLEHAIASLTGQPAPSFSLPAKQITWALPNVPAGVPSTLLQDRPDIVADEETVKSANASIGIVRAAYYPTLTITAAGGFQSTGLNLLRLPDSLWSVGPELAFPLFEGGLRHAEEEAAWAKLHQAVDIYRSDVLNAFQEVEDQLSVLHWGQQELTDATQALAAAQHTLDMAMALYQDGAESYLEVVVAQTALLQTQQTVIDLQARLLEADVSLIRAIGGGWSRPDLDVPLPAVEEAAR